MACASLNLNSEASEGGREGSSKGHVVVGTARARRRNHGLEKVDLQVYFLAPTENDLRGRRFYLIRPVPEFNFAALTSEALIAPLATMSAWKLSALTG